MRQAQRKRTRLGITGLAVLSLAAGLTSALPSATAAKAPEPAQFAEVTKAPPQVKLPESDGTSLQAYTAVAKDAKAAAALKATGQDTHEGKLEEGALVVLSDQQAAELRAAGVQLTGDAAQSRMAAPPGDGVYKPYSGPDGLGAEMVKLAQEHPDIAKVVSFGKSGLGQDMLAVRVTKDPKKSKDGSKPTSVYMSNQHAREWITPEMTRRLLNHYVDSYGKDKELTKLITENEFWFVLSANPDGYDWSRQPGQRMWRKNLRDNNGDGKIGAGDGVDLNRNLAYKWGYDDEGSSPNPGNETYRGPAADSEAETKAIEALTLKLKPRFVVNWHSAAQLLLYGVGWQVNTDSPDDLIMKALAGDDANPAVPGYDPDLSAELYTTNGELDGWMDNFGEAAAFTPEMTTCQAAAAWDPNDKWVAADCTTAMGSVFGFPDDEKLIQREYANNVPFALSVARSTEQPDEPVSALGLKAPALKVDAFETSYASKGDYQEVAVLAQRRTKDLKVNYSVNGGRAKSDGVREWRGGEKYGQDGTNWYSEYRGRVENLKPGDKVEVWFTGKQFAGNGQGGGPGKAIESDRFTFTVAPDIDKDAKVLVLADEDIKGVNPRYPAGTTGPKYAQQYQDALKANGVKSAVWNMDTQGTPHHLGVLSHFKGVVWYLGDNRLTQGPEDEFVPVGPTAKYPDAQVADRELDTTVSVRDYLNEGGKLLYTGETTAYFGLLKQQIGAATNSTGGIYYGMNGDPSAPCKVTQGYDDCLFLSDDFAQFYLGLDDRLAYGGATGFAGSGGPFKGVNAGLPGTPANPVNEAGLLRPTSKERYPQLGATALGGYSGATGNPYGPVEGSKYIAFAHQDDAYARLTRTVDLTNVTAAQAATLQAQFSFDTEEDYDHLIVEAHTVGQDDWTTLPDKNGGTNTDFPVECFDTTNAEYYVAGHPFLRHYLTPEGCVNTGTTGAWNAFTGNSGGWKPVAFDLSAYAGKQVEISISYVSDPGTGGAGVFIDDTKVTTTGGVLDAEGFETGLGPWTLAGPPAGETSTAKYAWTDNAYGSAVGTGDTLTLGFGIEQLATPADRNRVMGSALKYLFG